MSQYIRPRVGGATIFFTVTLAQRGSQVLVDHIGVLREAVAVTRAERPFQIDAAVVMPDHLHMVWTMPEGDAEYSVRWGAIKSRFTMGLRRAGVGTPTGLPEVRSGRYAGLKPGLRANKRESAVWQRRFWEHHIRDAANFRAHVEYCWMNPVKHGYVERPEEWPFSSYRQDREMWFGSAQGGEILPHRLASVTCDDAGMVGWNPTLLPQARWTSYPRAYALLACLNL